MRKSGFRQQDAEVKGGLKEESGERTDQTPNSGENLPE